MELLNIVINDIIDYFDVILNNVIIENVNVLNVWNYIVKII